MTPEEIVLMNEFKDDPEMFQVMLQSMREAKLNSIQIAREPTEADDPANICTIQFKGNKKVIRKFLKDSTSVQDLVNFYMHETKDSSAIELIIPFPKKDLTNLNAKLSELSFGKQETINVKQV